MVLPSAIANLQTWFRASEITPQTNGSSITTWPDSGPGGFNATQSDATRRPTLQTNQINGLAVARFDGSGTATAADTLYTTAPGNAAAQTVFMVAKSSNLTGAHTIRGGQLQLVVEGGTPTAYSNSVGLIGESTVDIGTSLFYALTFSTTSGTWAWYQNGTATGSGSGGELLSLTAVQAIGAADDDDPSREFWAGDIAEIITYTRVLTATERAQIHSYIQDRYNLAVADYVASPQPTPVQNPARMRAAIF